MDELQQQPLPETPPQRPVLLTVVCILTFIGSGMNIFSSLIIAGFHETFIQIAQEFADKFNLPGMEVIAEAKPLFFLVSAIFYAGSLAGAILMMNLKKTGFHLYTVSQILLILAPMYFLHQNSPGLADLLFSGIFILLYGMHLKLMK